MVQEDLPTFSQADKQRHLVRTGSAQSDSSGFAEADPLDVPSADWDALKVELENINKLLYKCNW